jgi:hypothetical protein
MSFEIPQGKYPTNAIPLLRGDARRELVFPRAAQDAR